MGKLRLLHLIALVFVLCWAGIATAQQTVTVPNAGFEQAAPDQKPALWTTATDPGQQARIQLDGGISHSGDRSLKIEHRSPAVTVVASQPLELRVGHLYRLTAWVRTDMAVSDPTSRYPTAVPACLTMRSFPATNHSPAVGATRGWTRVETMFIATQPTDQVHLNLGLNGTATGQAWFDDVSVEAVNDLSDYIPAETVTWFGPAYRYDDRGWIFVHIEGAPYQRGYQYGHLVADEIAAYILKLANNQNSHNPEAGWNDLRFMTEATMLRKYEPEFQTEMKGIADGARGAGAEIFDRKIDFVDVVCINSVIDLGQMESALPHTRNAISGMNFLKTEDELLVPIKNHKCSAVVTSGSATTSGRFVFGQIFMWNGYTGVHWDVICDVQPSEGHRFVHHTFPGGIHSGADFYISSSGLVMGETTVRQTPYNDDGTPQSNRIRKAIQYAGTVDEMVEIMTTRNNGQYTNEWPYAHSGSGEYGIFLLGTEKHRLWRASQKDFPGGLTDFYWCNNNNKDLEVRKEYILNYDNAPYDLAFRPWNRDIAFNEFFHRTRGRIDPVAVSELWASSPINRAHACDGKITSAEMAEQLVFLAHYGKLTYREKFPGGRFIRDLPGATPHLSLGYSTPSPIFITKHLQKAQQDPETASAKLKDPELDVSRVKEAYSIDSRKLWRNTVYPASVAENWYAAASAGYWNWLEGLPEKPVRAARQLQDQLGELNCRFLYTASREKDLAPLMAELRYDRYKDYEIPRIKGTFALHQLRLYLGNETFLKVMDTVHSNYAQKDLSTDQFIVMAEEIAQVPVRDFLLQWLTRTGLPQVSVSSTVLPGDGERKIQLTVTQQGASYHLFGFVDVISASEIQRLKIEISGASCEITLPVAVDAREIIFNAGNDFPTDREYYFTATNFFDDFHNTLIVYGTARQIEANHTLASRWQETVADAYTEILPPLRKDCEITPDELVNHDLMVLGQSFDNALLAELAKSVPELEVGKNYFRWQGVLYSDADDGLVAVVANPYNKDRVAYLFLANSARQQYNMTQRWSRNIPSWALYHGTEVEKKGYFPVESFTMALN